MTNILHISNYYFPNFGGTEVVAQQIATTLKSDADINQRVICFSSDAEAAGVSTRMKETVTREVDGIPVTYCGCVTKVFSQSLSLTYGRELRRVFREFQPDVVIFHYPNPFVAHYLLKYLPASAKLVVWWHLDIIKQKRLRKLFEGQNLTLIKRADRIVGTSPIYLEHSFFADRFGDKKCVIPNSIDPGVTDITDEERKMALEIRAKYPDQLLCFFIGRHGEYKGLTYLIEASRLMGDVPVKFLLAGSGELTESLKVQAAGDDKVVFLGRVSNEERRAYLEAMDVFCFPSITKNEAFGLALAEGMYYGKPAVTFTIEGSGVNYVSINGETGIECPNRDSRAYADAVLQLLREPEQRERLGANAASRVRENFMPQQFEANVRTLIAELTDYRESDKK